jgi:hypothetical protein
LFLVLGVCEERGGGNVSAHGELGVGMGRAGLHELLLNLDAFFKPLSMVFFDEDEARPSRPVCSVRGTTAPNAGLPGYCRYLWLRSSPRERQPQRGRRASPGDRFSAEILGRSLNFILFYTIYLAFASSR